MATDRDFIDYLLEQAALGARLTVRKMFGEYALYVDEKVVGFACDNSLFLKETEAATRWVPNAARRPPYPGAKDYPVLDEWLDDGDFLRRVLLASAEMLPDLKPKKKVSAKGERVAPGTKTRQRAATKKPGSKTTASTRSGIASKKTGLKASTSTKPTATKAARGSRTSAS